MNRCHLFILALLFAASHSVHAVDDLPEPPNPDLSAEISISPKLDANNGYIAKLILKNISKKPIRICTLCQGWGSEWSATWQVSFKPGNWRSDSPSLADMTKSIVTLAPGDTVSLPFHLRGAPYETIIASYGVGDDFAKRFNIWAGYTSNTIHLPPRTTP